MKGFTKGSGKGKKFIPTSRKSQSLSKEDMLKFNKTRSQVHQANNKIAQQLRSKKSVDSIGTSNDDVDHEERFNASDRLEGKDVTGDDHIPKDGEEFDADGKKIISEDIHYQRERKSEALDQLGDADARLNIALNKMGEITKRIQELEEERNQALRKEFLENEIKDNPSKELQAELDNIHVSNDKVDEVYQEVQYGYRSMSTRKNQLSNERDEIVKFIEEINDELVELGDDVSETDYATAKEEYTFSGVVKQNELLQKLFPDSEISDYGIRWQNLKPDVKELIGKELGHERLEI